MMSTSRSEVKVTCQSLIANRHWFQDGGQVLYTKIVVAYQDDGRLPKWRAGETEEPRVNRPSSGIVRPDSHNVKIRERLRQGLNPVCLELPHKRATTSCRFSHLTFSSTMRRVQDNGNSQGQGVEGWVENATAAMSTTMGFSSSFFVDSVEVYTYKSQSAYLRTYHRNQSKFPTLPLEFVADRHYGPTYLVLYVLVKGMPINDYVEDKIDEYLDKDVQVHRFCVFDDGSEDGIHVAENEKFLAEKVYAVRDTAVSFDQPAIYLAKEKVKRSSLMAITEHEPIKMLKLYDIEEPTPACNHGGDSMLCQDRCRVVYFLQRSMHLMAILSSHRQDIGGPITIVEIDESKLGKKKNPKSRKVEGHQQKKRLHTYQGHKRMGEPGTTIISDCWRGYKSLDAYGYHHLQVNHKKEPICSEKSGVVYRRNIDSLAGEEMSAEAVLGRIFRRAYLEKESSLPRAAALVLMYAATMYVQPKITPPLMSLAPIEFCEGEGRNNEREGEVRKAQSQVMYEVGEGSHIFRGRQRPRGAHTCRPAGSPSRREAWSSSSTPPPQLTDSLHIPTPLKKDPRNANCVGLTHLLSSFVAFPHQLAHMLSEGIYSVVSTLSDTPASSKLFWRASFVRRWIHDVRIPVESFTIHLVSPSLLLSLSYILVSTRLLLFSPHLLFVSPNLLLVSLGSQDLTVKSRLNLFTHSHPVSLCHLLVSHHHLLVLPCLLVLLNCLQFDLTHLLLVSPCILLSTSSILLFTPCLLHTPYYFSPHLLFVSPNLLLVSLGSQDLAVKRRLNLFTHSFTPCFALPSTCFAPPPPCFALYPPYFAQLPPLHPFIDLPPPFSPQLLFVSPSPLFVTLGSQDLVIKSCPNIFTHSLLVSLCHLLVSPHLLLVSTCLLLVSLNHLQDTRRCGGGATSPLPSTGTTCLLPPDRLSGKPLNNGQRPSGCRAARRLVASGPLSPAGSSDGFGEDARTFWRDWPAPQISSWQRMSYRKFWMTASNDIYITTAQRQGVFVDGHLANGAGMKWLGKREIPKKTRRPKASSSTIPTCENPVTRPGIEPASPWREASVLIAQGPWPQVV
ncbi:hypothetical protein PR048_009069 [Dryococelus australis]|uniref:ISXO2-like transposase domain-containing protein n=1 Tax=Dryococelus australis TaxID=614101 RepID=A0ABQ9HZY1_9NEOP|nr:hypothetical protein PR048_009069 [Dryococelus australis]